jgi:hypothetical protein
MRIASGIFAALFSVALAAPASAGCCGCNNGWSWNTSAGWGGGWGAGWGAGWGGGWNAGWGTGCGATVVVPARPVFVQPAPILIQPAPVLVQPAPILVQPAPIPAYLVNQGPVFSGPGSDFSPSFFQPAQPLRAYPYVSGARFATGYYSDHGQYHSSYRPHRTYRGADYRTQRAPRRSDYRTAPRYHRDAAPYREAVPPVKYYK